MKKLLLLFLLLPMLASSAEIITVTVTVTNASGVMGNTNTLVVNASTRTFTNNVSASPSTTIQETNTPARAATNIINHIGQYTFGAGFFYTQTSPTNVLIRGTPGTAMAASLAGAWGVITYSTQQIATPTYVVRVPHTNESVAVRTNIASGLADYLFHSTNAIPTNAVALSNFLHKGAGIKQVVRTSLQVTNLEGFVTALTNGYGTNQVWDRMTGTNGRFYGGLQSIGSGALSTQLGSNTVASGARSVALGNGAVSDAADSLSVGTDARATNGIYAMAIGNNARATNSESMAVGRGALAVGYGSSAIGSAALAQGYYDVALGGGAESTGGNGVIIGGGANANATNAIAIGTSAQVTGTNSIAIGYQATATHSNSIALGLSVATTASNQIRLGSSLQTVSIPGALHVSGVVTQAIHIGQLTIQGSTVYSPATITSAAAGANRIDATNGIMRITGTPGAAWSIVGMSGGVDGRVVTIYNDTGFTLTIANESGTEATAAYRLRTMAGADYVSGTNSVQDFFYDGTRSRWIMKFSNP